MRTLKAAAVLAALAATTAAIVPVAAQPEERAREWRDRAPGDDWLDREDRLWERGGRNDIDCPLSQVRREITTPLPEGWWNTPIVDNLSGAEVQVIGGRRTLVCKYGPAGQIMRLEPRRRDCVANRRGFDCRRARPGADRAVPVAPGWSGRPRRPPAACSAKARSNCARPSRSTSTRAASAAAARTCGSTRSRRWRCTLSRSAARGWPGRRRGRRRDCAARTCATSASRLAGVNVGTTLCYRTGDGRSGELTRHRLLEPGPSRVIAVRLPTWNDAR